MYMGYWGLFTSENSRFWRKNANRLFCSNFNELYFFLFDLQLKLKIEYLFQLHEQKYSANLSNKIKNCQSVKKFSNVGEITTI